MSSAFAADFSWNGSSLNWNNTANWLENGGSTTNLPGSSDDIVTPTLFTTIGFNVSSATVASWTYNSSSNQAVATTFGSAADLNITGTLTKSGTGALTFRESTSSINLSINHVDLSGGRLTLGRDTDPSTFTIGTADLTGGFLDFVSGGANGTITGALTMSGTSTLNLSGQGLTSANASVTEVNAGSLSSADSTTVVQANANSALNSVHNGTLVLNNTSGTATYAGIIKSGLNVGNIVNIEKNGNGTQTFSGLSNTYNGTTVINAGTLLVNGTHTGGGSYTVNNGGTLGGTGSIGLAASTNASVLSGGKLNASSLDSLAFTLSGTGVLDVSGALGGATSMLFTLGAPGSTVISLSGGGLNIGAGVLNFNDFTFTAGGGFNDGVYTLFGGANALTGTLGSSLTGNIAGQSSTISLSGNNVILTVAAIPEPSTWALLAAGLTVVITLRRRHR